MFEVKVRIAWGNDVVAQVPVTVIPSGSDRVATRRRAAPRIGGERLAQIWTAVGGELGLAFDATEADLRGSVGPVQVRIRREHRGGEGLFLLADLRYPDLGLGIDGGLAGSLRRVLGGGVAIGDDEWDQRHYLTGREPAQIQVFGKALRRALLPLRLTDIEDDRLSVERRDAGQNRAPLLRFGSDVLALARALPPATKTIPAPALMADGLPAWRQLAERLGGGELRTSDMAVFGRLDGAAVSVATTWGPGDEPEHTSIEYRGVGIASEKNAFVWAGGEPVSGSPDLDEGTKKLLSDVLVDAKSLTVATDRIVLWDQRAPILEFEPLRTRLEQLAALAAALQGRGGPYR